MADSTFKNQLTPREASVLELIVKGATSREAGEHLGVSPRTIEFHRANIMQKSAARNIADLIRMMFEGNVPNV